MNLSNATIELLRTRRSAPPVALAGQGPTAEERELLLTLAARVPDHGKLVPFRFIVFEGPGRDKAGEIIAEVFAAAHPEASAADLAKERKRLAQAPLVVAVVSRVASHVKVPEWEQVLCAGAVCFNLEIAANALGFASIWLTEWFAYDRTVLARFGLAEHEKIAGFIHIGHNAGPREDRVRPQFSEIVTQFGI
ncbi:nitroreductase [Methylovirgula ligni]|uniref:Putative NAD(P)H nitroreductase n=2 Tax=Methylovirgula ligni TaxID=569860 RepID=A0A3D9Z9N1_9HYPH|nr:nitroreductase [Methylovirgula ligni]REF87976.1 nitroreductase [Methylovirgula ligni]